ncbi:MAG: hypothetical protein ACREPR_25375 [Brasilonema sp.]
MGSGLGKLWIKNAHNLMFSYSRDLEKLKFLAQSIDASVCVGTPAEAGKSSLVVSMH